MPVSRNSDRLCKWINSSDMHIFLYMYIYMYMYMYCFSLKMHGKPQLWKAVRRDPHYVHGHISIYIYAYISIYTRTYTQALINAGVKVSLVVPAVMVGKGMVCLSWQRRQTKGSRSCRHLACSWTCKSQVLVFHLYVRLREGEIFVPFFEFLFVF